MNRLENLVVTREIYDIYQSAFYRESWLACGLEHLGNEDVRLQV